jgi:hypothetical protein
MCDDYNDCLLSKLMKLKILKIESDNKIYYMIKKKDFIENETNNSMDMNDNDLIAMCVNCIQSLNQKIICLENKINLIQNNNLV